MRKIREKILNTVDSNRIKFAVGVFTCLMAVFCLLCYTPSSDYLIYLSRFLNWCLSFLVGSYLAFSIYAVVFLVGLGLIFSNKKRVKVNLDITIFGISLIIVGGLILITNAQTSGILGETYLTFSNFEKIFNETLIKDFPQADLFNNSGIIGMFLVALINSGMTSIGSNVIGSAFLVSGAFFSLAKPSIKFIKIIADYYKATFGKKQLNHSNGFDIAKDISYDTNAITAIKLNNELKKEEIANEEKQTLETPTFVEEKEEPVQLFKTKKLVDSTSKGFSKAFFDIDEPKSTFIKPENELHEETQEFRQVETPIDRNTMVNANGFAESEPKTAQPASFISDMFSIPKKTSGPVREEFIQNDVQELKEEPEFVAPSLNNSMSNNFLKAPVFEEEVETNEDEQNFNSSIDDVHIEPAVAPIKEPEVFVKEEPKIEPLVQTISKEEQARIDELAKIKPTSYQENEYSNKIEVKEKVKKNYTLPSTNLLESYGNGEKSAENEEVADARTQKINQIFEDLGVGAKIISYTIGPSVTQYDVQTERNVSVNGLGKYISDISIRLGGLDARFVQIVQGKSTSGIEIANFKRETVAFKDCLEDLNNRNEPKLTIPFGKDIAGNFVTADLKDFPHLLVCGTTGSGKSIFIHSVIMSLIMRNTPEELKLVMIDPKRVEFGKYKEIAHLMCPPVTDSNKAFTALNKLVDLMEARYTLFEKTGVSNIKQYNAEAAENHKEKLPYIVLICDEFADLMDTNRKCSEPVVRIGQKARAAGIHMIIATQRPSVNVITGVIKANLPVRVALSCSSYTDSQTILGEGGAEKLLGNGDMLVMCPTLTKQGFTRVQGSFVDNKEIKQVCDFLRQDSEPDYDPLFIDLEQRSKVTDIDEDDQDAKIERAFDDKYEEVKRWVVAQEYTSISKIQRTFGFGFPRAGKMFAKLEEEGVIAKDSDPNNAKGRKVLLHYVETVEQSVNPGSAEQSTFVPNYDGRGDY